MKKILGRIWAIWGVTWFTLSLFIFLPFIIITRFFNEPSKSNIFYHISRWWMFLFLYGTGCPIRIRGKQHFAKGANYIVTANHNAFMDVPISSPFIPGTNKTIAKKDFMKVPIFNLVYERGGVLIDRKSEASRRKGYEDMKAVLARGWHMCIYPEGTRNKTNKPIQEFKDGAFRLAIETNKSIIPALLFNTKKAQPHYPSFTFYPTKIEMHFLAPIASEGHTAESLKNIVWQTMHDYYAANAK
jgi:1-acyl-sn-glycerol-3-phosphate acyltransferase